jgi:hypothetical protein
MNVLNSFSIVFVPSFHVGEQREAKHVAAGSATTYLFPRRMIRTGMRM